MNVNERSSKTVISAGITMPRWFSVAALYALQKSMMLMPCGPSAVPTGGAGVACPAWIWMLDDGRDLLLAPSREHRLFCLRTSSLLLALELGDLAELELDRGLSTEDVDQHLELRAVDVDLGDRAVEVGERAGDHSHLLAFLELDARAHLLLGAGPRAWPTPRMSSTSLRDSGVGFAPLGPTKPVTPGVLRTSPGVVVEVHAHEEVAGEHLLLDDASLRP